MGKLDQVDDAKRQRYRYVYEKLWDFERYLVSFGVDTTLKTPGGSPLPRQDAALLTPTEVVEALRWTAVDHNIHLMHRLGREPLFAATLEAARGEKSPARLRAYVSIFEEYFTYWGAGQKEQTLDFLYELLLTPDGDIRRRPPPSSRPHSGGLSLRLLKGASGNARRTPARCCPFSCGRSIWKNASTRTGG